MKSDTSVLIITALVNSTLENEKLLIKPLTNGIILFCLIDGGFYDQKGDKFDQKGRTI